MELESRQQDRFISFQSGMAEEEATVQREVWEVLRRWHRQQDLSEIRMVHLKAGEAEYRIRTESSPTDNTIFRAAEVPVPRRVNPVH